MSLLVCVLLNVDFSDYTDLEEVGTAIFWVIHALEQFMRVGHAK